MGRLPVIPPRTAQPGAPAGKGCRLVKLPYAGKGKGKEGKRCQGREKGKGKGVRNRLWTMTFRLATLDEAWDDRIELPIILAQESPMAMSLPDRG